MADDRATRIYKAIAKAAIGAGSDAAHEVRHEFMASFRSIQIPAADKETSLSACL